MRSVPLIAISDRLLVYVDYTQGSLGISIKRKQKGLLVPAWVYSH